MVVIFDNVWDSCFREFQVFQKHLSRPGYGRISNRRVVLNRSGRWCVACGTLRMGW